MVGRRESCDVVLRFANISSNHCQLFVDRGYWFAKDLNSRNGTKVNGKRVTRKRIDPGDTVAFAKHVFTITYSPDELGAVGPPPPDEEAVTGVLGRTLLDRAGLERRNKDQED
jgi:pSer/pThr/pTyr-binding forkhead associated (FHA) protein